MTATLPSLWRTLAMKVPALLMFGTTLLAATLSAQGSNGLPLRFPDIHGDVVLFSYAGDLWRVPSAGGVARRLTSHEGVELFPRISPDGKWVAFTGEYSGARQVYVMPIDGGTPKQLTFYTDVGRMPPRGGWDYWIQDWTADGKILVRCNRTPWGDRQGRYCLVDPDGGLETYLPLPRGGSASLSPDGSKIAYTPIDREFRTWKRTRGGRAQDIWIYDLVANVSERITSDRGTDNFPMWSGNTVYFLSDRDDTLNLFAYDTEARSLKKATDLEAPDVLWPSLGPSAIVFHRAGSLHRFDLAQGTTSVIPITIDASLPHTVAYYDDVSDNINAASLSPSGKRVVFEARGDLFSVPKKQGPTRNLARTSGIREKDPSWSPDGRHIAYFSDESGEYELYVRSMGGSSTNGKDPRKRLTQDSQSWLSNPVWSPDSKRLVWTDSNRRLLSVDIASGQITEVDQGTQGNLTNYSFSHDSRWLAYEAAHSNSLQAIKVYSFDTGSSMVLGDGLFGDFNPVFSADGSYLFFLSSRDYQPRFSDLEFNLIYDRSVRIFATPLNRSAAALFPPLSDEEEGDEEKGDEGKSSKGEEDGEGDGENDKESQKGGDGEQDKTPIVIEPTGFVERTISLPGIQAGAYGNLVATEGALFYTTQSDAGSKLMRYDLKDREEKQVLEGVAGFELSAKGEHLLYLAGNTWGIAEAKAGQDAAAGKLSLDGLQLRIDPPAEWAQMFDDGWRIFRDFFYDKKMHGVDWRLMGERYSALVDGIGHRSELDFIFGEMVGELEAGHTYVVPGEEHEVERVGGGKLGAELELDSASGRYRIAQIFQGENWDRAYRSPLLEPGVDVRVGDFLLEIDGEDLRYPDNPYRLLEGKPDTLVELLVSTVPDSNSPNRDPEKNDERRVSVTTIESEGNLRYIDWVKSRMALVNELSGGRIGYIHLPDTAIAGNRMLQKLFYGQASKSALIIDDRYNGGGFIPDRMIEYFERTTMSYWAQRDIKSFKTPGFANDGPKVMLINAYSGSGGDALPFYFRQKGLGTLIGTRTWGGLIGISGAPAFVDGGTVLPPTFRVYDPEGNWVVENEGVEPDIEVYDLPELLLDGGDPSIEKAVEVLLEQLDQGANPGPPDEPTAPDLNG